MCGQTGGVIVYSTTSSSCMQPANAPWSRHHEKAANGMTIDVPLGRCIPHSRKFIYNIKPSIHCNIPAAKITRSRRKNAIQWQHLRQLTTAGLHLISVLDSLGLQWEPVTLGNGREVRSATDRPNDASKKIVSVGWWCTCRPNDILWATRQTFPNILSVHSHIFIKHRHKMTDISYGHRSTFPVVIVIISLVYHTHVHQCNQIVFMSSISNHILLSMAVHFVRLLCSIYM